ncbi:acid phosphatase type 7-like [Convolutriloba macropyga]|uniref:acid phosphatase type 7-like n=1 Tax=Convolutriloba macropyga TaxID=536237 RepID=UPI003F526BA0
MVSLKWILWCGCLLSLSGIESSLHLGDEEGIASDTDGVGGEGEIISNYSPQQIHLSYTGQAQSMFVTFATMLYAEGEGSATFWISNSTDGQEKSNSTTITVNATKTVFPHKHNGITRLTYIFRATLEPLEPDTVYEYYVTSGDRQSVVFSFKSFPDTPDYNPTFAIYGDLGVMNHVSIPKLIQDLDAGVYDMVLHIGDFAYDMYERHGVQGDVFMNMIQPIATRVPYNVAVGNHEEYDNFTEYVNRFTSPPPSVFYHSFDLGPIHFVMFSSEFYFYDNYGIGQLQAQYNWLVEDLAKANTPDARNARPWIVAMAHRPMYCSSHDGDDCTKRDSIMRTGYKHSEYKLEDLFYENGVDLQFYAHEHDYERLYPIYNYAYQKVKNISEYHNPRYPVHVISGSAGCREIHDPFSIPKPKWSVVRSNNYGFTLMSVEDKLTLRIKQYSIVQGLFIDDLAISKTSVYPNFENTNH